MPTPRVIDLSHHNVIPDTLHPTRAAGVWGIIHKATEGNSFVDSKLDARYYLTKDAGMLWGAYHFLRPGNMKDQATFFVQTMLPFTEPNTLFACDFEVAGISLAEVDAFMAEVELLTYRDCVLYSGHSLKDAITAGETVPARLKRRPLWLAQYASKPSVPAGFKLWLWQYSDKGTVDGVTPPTDLNAFDGSIEELEATWAMPTEKAPLPLRPSVQIVVKGDVEVVVNGTVVLT